MRSPILKRRGHGGRSAVRRTTGRRYARSRPIPPSWTPIPAVWLSRPRTTGRACRNRRRARRRSARTPAWGNVLDGDGYTVAINDHTGGPSIFYATADTPQLARVFADQPLSPASPPTLFDIDIQTPNGLVNYYDYQANLDSGNYANGIVVAVNAVDPLQAPVSFVPPLSPGPTRARPTPGTRATRIARARPRPARSR